MNIKEIIKKDGTKVYRANVYLGVDTITGKQVRTTATAKTRKMCETKANQAINKFIKNGSTVAREKATFDNFEHLTNEWFEGYKLTIKTNTLKSTERFLRLYILPAFGSFKLDRITSVLIQNAVNKWANNANTSKIKSGSREKGKSKDFRLMLSITKRILDYALQLGAITENPALQVIPPKLKVRGEQPLKYFDEIELKKFLEYVDSLEDTERNCRDTTLYKFLLATGLRIGEALALSWSDIDFRNSSVHVSKTVLIHSSGIQDSPKTSHSNRTVYIDNETVQLLKFWRKRQNNNLIPLSDITVFSFQGVRQSYSNELLVLGKHFKNAGVPHIGFHGFRHTHASLLMNNDVNPKEIQHRLGHASYAMTMDIYSHLAKYKEKNTAEKFSNILKAL
ncbi:tyrosine-type recombinase/integrase [Lactococcus petauri]|uniref:tyrosine-type recombinase/integrase n=1 Tax=Lactococcus petauri TaxID=1940789 RepID=UPI003854D902